MTMPKLPKNFDRQFWPNSRPKRIPRTGLRGGYVFSGRTICDWARRNVKDIPNLQDLDDDILIYTAFYHFETEFESQAIPGVDVIAVGEVVGGDGEVMVYSHYLHFADGYLGMDPKDYPKQFEETSFDREVKEKLEQELGVKLEFTTRLG